MGPQGSSPVIPGEYFGESSSVSAAHGAGVGPDRLAEDLPADMVPDWTVLDQYDTCVDSIQRGSEYIGVCRVSPADNTVKTRFDRVFAKLGRAKFQKPRIVRVTAQYEVGQRGLHHVQTNFSVKTNKGAALLRREVFLAFQSEFSNFSLMKMRKFDDPVAQAVCLKKAQQYACKKETRAPWPTAPPPLDFEQIRACPPIEYGDPRFDEKDLLNRFVGDLAVKIACRKQGIEVPPGQKNLAFFPNKSAY